VFTAALGFFLTTIFWCVFSVKHLKTTLMESAGNLLVLPYLVLPFTVISEFQKNSSLNNQGLAGTLEMVMVFSIIWLSDSAAYLVGRKIGKHKITPRISPNKSLEGFVAGLVVPAVATPWIGYLIGHRYPWYLLALVGLIVAVSSIVGDLFESTLKRGAGIKDTSNLIPGHGGILDRVDSLLLAFPAYYLLTTITSRI
jgi:CDP-diglyceride synthetase